MKKINNAIVYTDSIEEACTKQIEAMSRSEALTDIRIMPDCHAGKGTVIGMTAKFNQKVIPNVIGVDIGCGMLTCNLGNNKLDLNQVDDFTRNNIPAGLAAINPPKDKDSRNKKVQDVIQDAKAQALIIINQLLIKNQIANNQKELNYLVDSIGSLGSGNHFLEVAKNQKGENYLIIHTGSRSLGSKVATYYQQLADEYFEKQSKKDLNQQIKDFKAKGATGKEIADFVAQKQKEATAWLKVPKELRFIEGQQAQDYLHDMKLAQQFATLNRNTIAKIFCIGLGLDFNKLSSFETIHNYISDDNIMRKGAISAKQDEIVLIPINMRDGSIIAKGKGNPEWNFSAPHGAGRILSRTEAKKQISLNDFKKSMSEVVSSTVSEDTIDESPFAYKSLEEIINNTKDTIEVLEIIKPIYNFKGEINLPFVPRQTSKETKEEIECSKDNFCI